MRIAIFISISPNALLKTFARVLWYISNLVSINFYLILCRFSFTDVYWLKCPRLAIVHVLNRVGFYMETFDFYLVVWREIYVSNRYMAPFFWENGPCDSAFIVRSILSGFRYYWYWNLLTSLVICPVEKVENIIFTVSRANCMFLMIMFTYFFIFSIVNVALFCRIVYLGYWAKMCAHNDFTTFM